MDFIILDIEDDHDIPMILNPPLVNMGKFELILIVDDVQEVFNIHTYSTSRIVVVTYTLIQPLGLL